MAVVFAGGAKLSVKCSTCLRLPSDVGKRERQRARERESGRRPEGGREGG